MLSLVVMGFSTLQSLSQHLFRCAVYRDEGGNSCSYHLFVGFIVLLAIRNKVSALHRD